MPSTAEIGQKTKLNIETGRAAAKTITALSNAAAPVVGSTAHGYSNGDYIYVDGVVGMFNVNGRVFVVSEAATDTFKLKGMDFTDTDVFGTYASGGSAYKLTVTAIANVVDVNGQRDAAAEIDVTNLDSDAKEYRVGLQGSWTMDLTIDVDDTNAGQSELRLSEDDRVMRAFVLKSKAGKVWAGVGYGQSGGFTVSPDATLRGTAKIRGSGLPMGWV